MINLKPQDEASFYGFSSNPIMQASIREQGADVAKYNFVKGGVEPDLRCTNCGKVSNANTNQTYFETIGCPFCDSLNVVSMAMILAGASNDQPINVEE